MPARAWLQWLLRYSMIIAFAAIFVFFSAAQPTFLSGANLLNVLVNNFALLAIAALGLTLIVSSGGIDLSIGTAIDMASMVFVMMIAAGNPLPLSLGTGLAAAGLVGVFNALLIARLRIMPFLATLGTLFIGQSIQQLSTNGGNPIYLMGQQTAAAFAFLGRGKILGLSVSLWLVAAAALLVFLLLSHTRYGRYIRTLGAQPGVAWYSGLRVRRHTALVYILSALLCGVTGLLLSATVRSYVPLSGNAFLLDAIGAVFIGATLSRESRPTAVGTLLGVLLLGMVKNGLLLIGWNFYWQQVGTGVVIFLVLAVSFASRRMKAVQ